MPPLACPQCAKPLPEEGPCGECGLDASLLQQIRRVARRLARTAAQRAASGAWQEAYDTAAESLRLSRSDNDLAAFVLLAAALCGAQGAVATLPRPRAAALPAPLAPLVEDLLAAAGRLRALGASAASLTQIDDIRRALREVDDQHPLLALLAAPPAPVPASAPVPARPLWQAVAAAAVAALLAGALAGWKRGTATERQATQGQIAALQHQILEAQTRPAPPVADPAPVPTPPHEEPWVQALRSLPTYAMLQDKLSSQAYKQGRDASGKHPEEARRFLELAVQGPPRSWYRSHALFFLGKTYHRLGRREDAIAAYRRLEREAPQAYPTEVRRLLARAEQGQGVGR